MAISVAAVGNAGSGAKVTGGGQTDVGTSGAGDTIALTAQDGAAGVIGQVQYIDREGGTGAGQVVYHGTVTCLNVEPTWPTCRAFGATEASSRSSWRTTDPATAPMSSRSLR